MEPIHQLPETSSEAKEHILTEECWCYPNTEKLLFEGGVIRYTIIHNHSSLLKEDKGGTTS